MSVFYFNRLPVVGPWGGGNKTLSSLVQRLTEMGHTVTGSPREDVDVIFCFDPRPSSTGMSFDHLIDYSRHLGAPIVQRVGDVGTHGKPDLTDLVRRSITLSNRVVFTSEWARDYVAFKGDCRVIPNGPLPVFYGHRRGPASPRARPRIVTHHWSNNPLKGIQLYEMLTREIQTGNLNFDFTYVGRSSGELVDCTMSPMNEEELAVELPQHDIYLSASQLEAGANHIVEAMACGLPVVYHREGGSIPEYCGSRGESFSTYDEMIAAIHRVVERYQESWESSHTYVRTMNDATREYLEILCEE